MSDLENSWREIIRAWRQSGETQRAYSQRIGRPAHQLSYWSRKLEGLAESSSFIPPGSLPAPGFVELESNSVGSSSVTSTVELEFRDGLVLRIRG